MRPVRDWSPSARPRSASPNPPYRTAGRYQAMADRYGPVALDPAVCGLHAHVGVPDRELAVQVCNHLQAWLPVIRALGGNSPLYQGADTGHASWRSVQLLRWPGCRTHPSFDSAADYHRTVAALIVAGVMLDEAMVYWYARLSPTYPTVEVRVSDVCADVDDPVLTAALIRAAVATAIADIRAGHPAPRPRERVVAAAHWRAARDGLSHTLIDLRLDRARPAWDLVDEFFAVVSPALLHAGDLLWWSTGWPGCVGAVTARSGSGNRFAAPATCRLSWPAWPRRPSRDDGLPRISRFSYGCAGPVGVWRKASVRRETTDWSAGELDGPRRVR